MIMNLDNAVVYDEECIPNLWLLTAIPLHDDTIATWEISEFRDDRVYLFQWLDWLQQTQTPMIGFNNERYDYSLLEFIFNNRTATNAEIYQRSTDIIKSGNNPNTQFKFSTWASKRFAPQIDTFKINHFDNKAKTTSLKALEINMRADNVHESRLPFDRPATREEVINDWRPYNISDVKETKRFAHMIMPAIEFRIGLMPQFGLDVLNFNDTKIGEKMLEQRLGDDVCYDRIPRYEGDNYGKKVKKQTPRHRIALNEIIFPYVSFQNPEFNRVLDYLRAQVLTSENIATEMSLAEEIAEGADTIKTKGVFHGLSAMVGGVSFDFGTGGIHASVTKQRFQAGQGWIIRDIDVASLYPSIAIKNRLAPAHLGEAFIGEYAKLPAERKEWQIKKGKKCVEANSLKLAGNGAYGKTNSKYSFLYDPQYTMTVTINGQLLLCMLAEWLVAVPTLQIIQVNTDGITYFIKEEYEPQAAEICKRWEAFTLLTLEDADYSRMWIADVNTYIAEGTDGSLKQKGRLWHPDPQNYAQSISECQPPAWHKDLGNCVSIRAAVAAMVQGVDPATFIRSHSDPFDFMLRVKAERGAQLLIGGVETQKTTRYYVAHDGQQLIKRSEPKGTLGAYKKANGITDAAYAQRMAETGGQWCETVCTKNKSTYQITDSSVQAGWKVAECNRASEFHFGRVDYGFYEQEARKLIIA